METNALQETIKYFDHIIKDVDFKNLPHRDTEEYRHLLMKTADECIFPIALTANDTKNALKYFDNEEVRQALTDTLQISSLSEDEKQRYEFYLHLKEMCYPLYKGEAIDWTAWPWNMGSSETSIYNKDLRDFLNSGKYVYLSCAICYDMAEYVRNSPEKYSAMLCHELPRGFYFQIGEIWMYPDGHDRDDMQENIKLFTESLLDSENHMKVGKKLGFDILTQSLYDVLSLSSSEPYEARIIDCAEELAEWIKTHLHIPEEIPTHEEEKEFWKFYDALIEKYDIEQLNCIYTSGLIRYDILGVGDEIEREIWNAE